MGVYTHVPEGAKCKHSHTYVWGACTQVSVCRDDACVRGCATEELRVSEWGPAHGGTRGVNCVHKYLNPGWRGSV